MAGFEFGLADYGQRPLMEELSSRLQKFRARTMRSSAQQCAAVRR